MRLLAHFLGTVRRIVSTFLGILGTVRRFLAFLGTFLGTVGRRSWHSFLAHFLSTFLGTVSHQNHPQNPYGPRLVKQFFLKVIDFG